MLKQLMKTSILPAVWRILKAEGFKKKGSLFIKTEPDGIEKTIGFQISRGSSETELCFYINIGMHSDRFFVRSSQRPAGSQIYCRIDTAAAAPERFVLSNSTEILEMVQQIESIVIQAAAQLNGIRCESDIVSFAVRKCGLQNFESLCTFMKTQGMHDEIRRYRASIETLLAEDDRKAFFLEQIDRLTGQI